MVLLAIGIEVEGGAEGVVVMEGGVVMGVGGRRRCL